MLQFYKFLHKTPKKILFHSHFKLLRMSQLGFEYAVESARSLVISCALAEKQISVEKATSLSRLEVEFQVSVAQVFVVVLGCSHVREFSEGTVYTH